MNGRTLTRSWSLQEPASPQGLPDRDPGAAFVCDQQAPSSLTLYLGPALSPCTLPFGFIISVQKCIPLTLFYQREFPLCCSALGKTCTAHLWISQNTDLEPHVSKTPLSLSHCCVCLCTAGGVGAKTPPATCFTKCCLSGAFLKWTKARFWEYLL